MHIAAESVSLIVWKCIHEMGHEMEVMPNI